MGPRLPRVLLPASAGARLPAILTALLLLAACNDASKDPVGATPQATAASIEITGAASGPVGVPATLIATVRDSTGATLTSLPVSWRHDAAAGRLDVIPRGLNGLMAEVNPVRIVSGVRIIASAGDLQDTLVFGSHLPRFAFVFADTVPTAERLLLLDAVQDARTFQHAAFDKRLSDSITISGVYAAPGCANGGAAAFASGRAIAFCLGNPGWTAHGPGIRQKIVHHEMFHLWQFAYWSGDPAKSPAWLVEGTAELMGYYGIKGSVSFGTALGCQRKESADFAANRPPGLPPLQTVETRQAFQGTIGPLYTHSMLGAHYLVESGDGLAALEAYGNVVGTSAGWQAAFEQAFAMTPATFYAEFPGYVAEMPVPTTYHCRL